MFVTDPAANLLLDSFRLVNNEHPFIIEAMPILPDHVHSAFGASGRQLPTAVRLDSLQVGRAPTAKPPRQLKVRYLQEIRGKRLNRLPLARETLGGNYLFAPGQI
jgi:hypothetical protein